MNVALVLFVLALGFFLWKKILNPFTKVKARVTKRVDEEGQARILYATVPAGKTILEVEILNEAPEYKEVSGISSPVFLLAKLPKDIQVGSLIDVEVVFSKEKNSSKKTVAMILYRG